jgi:hypothetical protein
MGTRETAMLILQRGGEPSVRWPLERSQITIGRSPDCDIVLDDRQVSRHHALIRWENGQYIVQDLGSKNGTHVNGRELTGPYVLQDGDEIQIALRYRMAFVDTEETAPLVLDLPSQGLTLVKETRQVYVGGKELSPPLSLPQYRLLELLVDAGGGIVNRETVVHAVWPEAMEEGVSEQAIDALVRRLRERIAELDPDHTYVLTVRGHGFRFQNRT